MSPRGPVHVSTRDIPPSHRQGGTVRAVLTPKTAGTCAGFLAELALEPGELMTEHYHPWSDEHVFVVEGEMVLSVEGVDIRLADGEGSVVRRGARHGYRNVGDVPARAVAFLGPLAPDPSDGHVDVQPVPHPAAAVPAVGSAS